MINPTTDDIGRKVIYTSKTLSGKITIEEGVITSFNKDYVFVRYGSGTGSAATRREDLTWMI